MECGGDRSREGATAAPARKARRGWVFMGASEVRKHRKKGGGDKRDKRMIQLDPALGSTYLMLSVTCHA
jgi:hypothetical protein